MTSDNFKRKLTAILSADVIGYSRLMGEDEESTVRTLNKYKEIIFDLIKRNNGRLVDSVGDNVLSEFASVVDAVRCGVQIQEDLKEHNKEIPPERKMEFRIGIHTGDVIQDGDRIYGDGVNVASRIESLSDPGGICLSSTAYDQVKKKLSIEYEDLGDFEVKNIDEPIKVYKVSMDSVPDGFIQQESSKELPIVTDKSNKKIIGACIILLIIIVGLFVWRFYPSQPEKQTPKTIAVLPFENLSPDKGQEYFAEGIAEELLNYLTRISELEVRGRTSSFYFKDKTEDLPTISKMLNVEYILEGSVRKAGEQVRITVQLINTHKDAHVWSETYERTMDDIFAIQDDIAQSVADALQITLGVGELGRAPGMTSNIDAYDAFLAGHSLMLHVGRENASQAIEKLKQAVAMDPEFAVGWKTLAEAYDNAVDAIPGRGEEFIAKRDAAFSRAVELAPETDFALVRAAIGSGDYVEVEQLLIKALLLDPMNYAMNYEYGWLLNNVGRPKEAVSHFQRLVRMEPLSSRAHTQLALTYEMSGNSNEATMALKKARELTNQHVIANAGLLLLAMENNNRALIDQYMALILNTELLGDISDRRDINQVMHALLDTPEEAGAELRLFLADPAYNNPTNRSAIAVWASYFGEHDLALQACRESIRSDWSSVWLIWRPIYKGMRQLPGFKELVRDLGLVDYWEKSGKWGDFCRPVGDNDFECD